jgi:hypothetical protein
MTAAKKKRSAAGPATMTIAELADEFGPLEAELKPLEKRSKALKEEFAARGLTALIGEKFIVLKAESSFDGVDVVAAKAALGAQWCLEHSKPVTRVSWKVGPKPEQVAPAMAGAT